MAKWGKCDFKELKELQQRLEKLEKADLNKFCEDASKELAARLLALVIPATPVGSYTKETGKKGGTLRRGWTAGKKINAQAYAKSLPVQKVGTNYVIVVTNPVKYASYVEFGHRQTPGRFVPDIGKRLKSGWVEGQYFLTISEEKLKQQAPRILQQKLEKYLQEAFNG